MEERERERDHPFFFSFFFFFFGAKHVLKDREKCTRNNSKFIEKKM